MTLLEKIENDFKKALAQKEAETVSCMRMLRAALHNKEIELRPKKEELTDEIALEVIASEAKKRKESIEAYEKGKRVDLANKERKELEILKKYLPEELSGEELEKIIKETIGEVGATGMADFGKVMGAVMGKVKGRAEGDKVSKIVRELLSESAEGE